MQNQLKIVFLLFLADIFDLLRVLRGYLSSFYQLKSCTRVILDDYELKILGIGSDFIS